MAKKRLKKSEKRLLIVLGIVVVLSAVMLYRIYGPQPKPEIVNQSNPVTADTTETQSPAVTSSGRSGSTRGAPRGGGGGGGGNSSSSKLMNLADHNKPNDCWVTIDGSIYDITGFIQEYQSDEPSISNYCGTYAFEIGFLEKNPTLRKSVLESAIKK